MKVPYRRAKSLVSAASRTASIVWRNRVPIVGRSRSTFSKSSTNPACVRKGALSESMSTILRPKCVTATTSMCSPITRVSRLTSSNEKLRIGVNRRSAVSRHSFTSSASASTAVSASGSSGFSAFTMASRRRRAASAAARWSDATKGAHLVRSVGHCRVHSSLAVTRSLFAVAKASTPTAATTRCRCWSVRSTTASSRAKRCSTWSRDRSRICHAFLTSYPRGLGDRSNVFR
mmetsp:Transcript_28718/g.88987  ORF Transcript_28718/g.88987 Transcript_28718/m.88987 type:complete len:232 (-) Transcript_28718:79-774(-)